MENTLSFADVLKDIHAENLREKLQALETEYGVRKLSLSNPLTDVVYMTGNELLLVKGDFLPPDKRVESWLADEESCNNEPPLYFSESSHRESPLYALQRAQAFYSRFSRNLLFPSGCCSCAITVSLILTTCFPCGKNSVLRWSTM